MRGHNMQFSGIQKLTLLDYPGIVACTLFTQGCNFRCPFCHNALLVLPSVNDDSLSEDEILGFLEKRKGRLEGVAVTGGEPTLHRDLPAFLAKVSAMGYRVKLDTNGTNPDMLRSLAQDGLVNYVAMDVKNSPRCYTQTAGTTALDWDAIGQSKDFLLSDAVEYEFRTTVVKGLHSAESLAEAAQWIRGARAYYLQKYEDSGNLIAPEGLSAFSKDEMNELADAVRPYVAAVALRGI